MNIHSRLIFTEESVYILKIKYVTELAVLKYFESDETH